MKHYVFHDPMTDRGVLLPFDFGPGKGEYRLTALKKKYFPDVMPSHVDCHDVCGTTQDGVFYDEGLAGPGGMRFILFKFPSTKQSSINEAKRHFRRTRDVVGFFVINIKTIAAGIVDPDSDLDRYYEEVITCGVGTDLAREIRERNTRPGFTAYADLVDSQFT